MKRVKNYLGRLSDECESNCNIPGSIHLSASNTAMYSFGTKEDRKEYYRQENESIRLGFFQSIAAIP